MQVRRGSWLFSLLTLYLIFIVGFRRDAAIAVSMTVMVEQVHQGTGKEEEIRERAE
jgi:hypothetical protein